MESKEDKVRELQILEQNLHNLLLQKQAFQMELSETRSALDQISDSGEIYKMVGDLMIKSDSKKVKEELSNKEEVLNLRIKSIGKQEESLTKKLEEMRNLILNLAK